MLWRLELATVWRLNQVAKIACFAETGAVFKLFQFFPRIFVTVHLLSKHSPSQTLRAPFSNLLCCIFTAQNRRVPGMGFLIFTLFYLILCFSLWFFAYVCDLEMGLCFGFCSLFMLSLRMLLLEFDLILVVSLLLFILCLAKCFFYFNLNFELLSCFYWFILRLWVLLC